MTKVQLLRDRKGPVSCTQPGCALTLPNAHSASVLSTPCFPLGPKHVSVGAGAQGSCASLPCATRNLLLPHLCAAPQEKEGATNLLCCYARA